MVDVIDFQISYFGEVVSAQALGRYHKYWIDKNLNIKNNHFDEHSRRTLDIKRRDLKEYSRGVSYFQPKLQKLIEGIPAGLSVEISAFPSSKQGEHAPGLILLIDKICRSNKNMINRDKVLRRTKTISKLATGGDRSYVNQLASLDYQAAGEKSKTKIILDDVATTGNSLIAGFSKIAEKSPGSVVYLIALARTASD